MVNIIQKFIFTGSALSPLLLCAACVHWYNVGLIDTVLYIGILGLILFACSPIQFLLAKKLLPPMRISIVKTTEVDYKLLIKYTFIWLAPLTDLVLKGEHIWVYVLLGIVVWVLLSLSNYCVPNLCLFLMGYHYHEIITENNEKPRYMLSKRSYITDATSIRKVIAIFNHLWIEVL